MVGESGTAKIMMDIESRLIIIREPNSPVAESYRSLRATLSRSLTKGKRRFMVVSSWPGEGKSMVSANLAIALSQLLMEVILIDGDLRKPTVSRVFEHGDKPGVMDLLESEGEAGQLLCPTPIERLSILPAGRSRANPGDLLGKGGFHKIFDDPMISDKCVVLDTSPMSACSDALLMGPVMDGALMVVGPTKWQGEPEAHFAQDLEDHGIEILGAILNGADPSEQSSGSSYGYGYGYGYGQEESQTPKKKGLLSKILRDKT